MNKQIRADRIAIAKNRCEWCGISGVWLQFHHLVDRSAKLRNASEVFGVECGRMLCVNCHLGSKKHECIPALRVEFDAFLRSIGKTDEEIREITGRKLYI